MSTIEEVRGKQVTIRFEPGKCIHSRNCVLTRPDVFVPNVEGDWIYPDRARPEEIAALAHNCPSGAIQYERHDGATQEAPPIVNTAQIREAGPIAIHAPITITDGATHLRATICRCGASNHKPYCDGSHHDAHFTATGEPATSDSQPLATRDGPLTINPLKNGPLLVSGNLEITTGTGRTINRVTSTALCRCGHSANKPYCDGSHVKAGFTS